MVQGRVSATTLKLPSSPPFLCEVCSKILSTKANLQNHLRTHENLKEFRCTLCTAAFNNPSGLKHHITSVHSDERPYYCHSFQSTFKLRAALRSHEFAHALVKPVRYKCPMCSFGHWFKYCIENHIRTRDAGIRALYAVRLCSIALPETIQLAWGTSDTSKHTYCTETLQMRYLRCKILSSRDPIEACTLA